MGQIEMESTTQRRASAAPLNVNENNASLELRRNKVEDDKIVLKPPVHVASLALLMARNREESLRVAMRKGCIGTKV